MENNTNADTGNKNIIKIIAFVILGIIVGYFLAGSKINPTNQGAQTISSDIDNTERTAQCPTHMVYNPETGQCEPATPERTTWQNWQEIKSLPIVQREEKIEELLRTNSKMIRNIEDFGVIYEIYDPETGLPMKEILKLSQGYTFSNSRLSEDKTRTEVDILKQDPRNPLNYTVLRESYSCGGRCVNNGCCQMLNFGHWAACDCDSGGGSNDGCDFARIDDSDLSE